MKHLKLFLFSLLGSSYIRLIVGYFRWFYYLKILKRLKTKEISKNIIHNGLSHNLMVFDEFPLADFVMKRTSWLFNSISSIEFLNNNSKFLSIGPRTESDILILKSKFNNALIEAIDIISYSPWIKLQDMHSIEFEDDFFDCVISTWVIPYSENQKLAIKEMIRILKNGGIFAIGFEHLDKISIAEHKEDKKNDSRLADSLKNQHKDVNSVKDVEDILLDLNVNYETLTSIDAPLKGLKSNDKLKLTGLKSSQVIYLARITK